MNTIIKLILKSNRLYSLVYWFITIIVIQACNTSHQEPQSDSEISFSDSLPSVFTKGYVDLKTSRLDHEASLFYAIHQLPNILEDWKIQRQQIKSKIIQKAGVKTFPGLPLHVKVTGKVQMKGYSIENIYFQTRPGIYATANLYIPDGNEPFPAVINMIGHFSMGKIGRSDPQGVGHSLASRGYVCLSIDPWGYGERTTIHGDFEYHGSNLGASLMNIGETLMGMQLSDNIRGVDLLQSLSYVDKDNIGATGASGGGHQTLYLTAMDERVKSAVPVVSIGTFTAIYNRGCICNMLLNGLTFTEEAGVLALIAPRAVKICNHNMDSSPAFYPDEMLRTFHNTRPIFEMYGVKDNITYQLFDLTHGYKREDREAMIGWFDLHLKGIASGQPKKEIPFETVLPEKLMVFPKGKRAVEIATTEEYCKKKGAELRSEMLNTGSFKTGEKKQKLRDILGIKETLIIKDVHHLSNIMDWDKVVIETVNGQLIPLLLQNISGKSKKIVIICNPEGKKSIERGIIEDYISNGFRIAVVDLSGTGEFITDTAQDYRQKSQILARSELWLGKTILGEWVKELDLLAKYLHSIKGVKEVIIDGSREAGLAALFLSALEGNVNHVILREAPVSYLFDSRNTVDFYSMGIHIPGFLNWGDVSLAAALTGKSITFIDPLTMSGNSIAESKLEEFRMEFEEMQKKCGSRGKIKIYNF